MYDKVILVTGGAGFIGSHVTSLLVKTYPTYKVINFDKLDYCSSLVNIQDLDTHANYSFVKGDICDVDIVNYVIQSEKVDTILNFAAQTHVDTSFGNSFPFTKTNVMGTHVLLEAAKTFGVKLFLHVSEESGEASPYGGSKAGGEYLVKAYHRSFGLPVIITRGNNVYGPHQYPEKIIPKFITMLMRGQKLTLHGSGTNSRNFLYVQDVARAFDILLHRGCIGDVYNIGGSTRFQNVDVAKQLIRLFHGSAADADAYVEYVEDRPFNDTPSHLDSTKLIDLGWREETGWEEGLRKTVEWYRLNSNNWGDQLICPTETDRACH